MKKQRTQIYDKILKENLESALLWRLKQLSHNENDLHKYLDQLNLLSQARKLDSLTAITIKEMPLDCAGEYSKPG